MRLPHAVAAPTIGGMSSQDNDRWLRVQYPTRSSLPSPFGQQTTSEQLPLMTTSEQLLPDHLKRAEIGEELLDGLDAVASKLPSLEDSALVRILDHYANTDSLLVEVHADVMHDFLPVWKRV